MPVSDSFYGLGACLYKHYIMKHLFSIILVATLLLCITSDSTAQGKKDVDLFEVTVAGLGCPFCAYGLEKKLKEFKGVKKLKIDMETGDVSFTFPSTKILALSDVEYKVDHAGYTAMSTKVTRYTGEIEESAEVTVSDKVDMNNLAKTTLYVEGTCKMCRARINKAVQSVEGVADADWDKKTKILSFSYDKKLTSKDDIEKAVVAIGHDTQNMSADDEMYDNLPACCLYDRIQREN